MAFVSVYNKIGKIKMVHTGNALGLNQNPRVGNDTTQTLMISLNTSLSVAGTGVTPDTGPNTYGGTTRDWTQSGSWANLTVSESDVPKGSTIDHARLIWQTNYGSSPQPTLAFCQTTPVNFIAPNGVTYVLSPGTTDNSGFNKVANSVDVTTILNNLISAGYERALGNYSVSRVPISVQVNVTGGSGGAGYVGAGWGLVIFYTHPDLPYTSQTLYVGDLPQDTTQNITGFYTPEAGTVKARIYTQASLSSSIEGDTFQVNTTGQPALYASGPNNPRNPPYPINNFLSSVICDYLGNINYKCGYGNANANPLVFNAGVGVKTEFTITNVSINGYLKNASRSATIRSTGDISSLGAFGLEVQVNQAYFAPTKTSDKNIYYPGETVSYTIGFPNSGGTTASSVVFVDTLSSQLSFIPNSIAINGATVTGANLSGVSLPNIPTNTTVTVTFKAIVSSTIAVTTTIPNQAWIGYNFLPDPNLTATRDSNLSNTSIITVYKQNITATKTVDKIYSDLGETLNYNIILNNTGPDTYTSVRFQDTIPSGTTFVNNSLTVNSVTLANNPTTAITIGTIANNAITTIAFSVTVNSTIPSTNPIPNNSTTSLVYNDSFGNTIPLSLSSNAVFTQVNNGTLSSAIKTANPIYAGLGETITYSIVLKNTGSTSSNNVILIDTVPFGTTFVEDSLKINGAITDLDPQPPTGANLGSIAPNTTSTITFEVVVTTIPTPQTAINNANISYNYTVNPTIPTTTSRYINTNAVTTTINYAQIDFGQGGFTKSVNKNFATVGEKLTYTLVLKNTGNITANNVTIIDTIPSATTFVSNSLKLNGVTQTLANPTPPTGVNIGSLGPNRVATVTFDVNVVSIPTANPIVNDAFASFRYTGNPSVVNGLSASGTSNNVNTQINDIDLNGTIKGVDKAFAKVSDIITYTITIPNTGNTTITNVAFIDTIPNGTSFIPNSVIINGVTQNGYVVAPPSGASLGTIGPNSTTTLSFKVRVDTIPSPNPIPNSGTVNYQYIVDTENQTLLSGSKETNTVTTQVNDPLLRSTKKVTPTDCIIGDTINYTIVLYNTGNITANNIVFIDTIPTDTTFEDNSLKLNNVTQTGLSPAPPNGFSVGTMGPNAVNTITFSVIVDTIPTDNLAINRSTTSYDFVVNTTTGETVSQGTNSNTVVTYVNPDSNPLKNVDLRNAVVGDILTYSVVWTNVLNQNELDVTFIDTIPSNSSFVANSVTVDSVTVPGASVLPPSGLNIGTIPSLKVTTITFKVKVDSVPNPNPMQNQLIAQFSYISDATLGIITTETRISNYANTQIVYASIPNSTKTTNKDYAKVGDIINYTISFQNVGNSTATDIVVLDTIPEGTSFVINSVSINGSYKPGEVVYPPTGLTYGNLGANEIATITFDIKVDTIPLSNPIQNNAFVSYKYIIDPIVENSGTGNTTTNAVYTQVNFANLNRPIKTTDKQYAIVNDVITYTINLNNIGNVTSNNVIITDTIPNDTTFENGSILINGIPNSVTLPTNNILTINMGNIPPSGSASLTFKVSIASIPATNFVKNSANTSYVYTVNPTITNGASDSYNSNIVSTQVNSANLSSISKFVDKVYASCGDIITYTVSIPNTGNVTATNVILSDTVPNGTVLVPDSILVNGLLSSATSPTNVPLGTINPGATTTVSFKVRVQC